MTYTLKISPEAWEDLRQTSHYIIDNFNAPHSAAKIVGKITTRIEQLTIMPECGRLYMVESGIQFRSVRAARHNIAFSLDKEKHLVKVLLIAHSRRNLTTLLKSRQQSQD